MMTLDIPITFEERDEFSRKNIAEKVITLLKSDITVSPLVIDGSWGLGKTEFCIKLINLMSKQDTHHLIYIDAFKSDHADEPLLTVLAKVLEILPSEEKQKGFIQKAIPALRYGLKTGGKALISHVLRQDTDSIIEGFDEEVKQVADKAIDSAVESLLRDHVDAEKNLKALQQALMSVVEQKPIVLFIDELDRCRPDFSVLMLETIKHTFDVEGVQFVLVTNTNQLKASINHCYGPTIDAQRYLDKFIKFSFTLPHTYNENRDNAIMVSVSHYKNLIAKSELLKDLQLDRDSCFGLVEQVINTNNVSLREVETFVRHIEIYQILFNQQPLSNDTHWVYKLMRLLGILLVSLKPSLANAILLNVLDAKDLGSFMGVEKLPQVHGNQYPSHSDVLMFMLGSECKYNSDWYLPANTQDKKMWEEEVNEYFRGNHNLRMSSDHHISIVTNAIKGLGLSAN